MVNCFIGYLRLPVKDCCFRTLSAPIARQLQGHLNLRLIPYKKSIGKYIYGIGRRNGRLVFAGIHLGPVCCWLEWILAQTSANSRSSTAKCCKKTLAAIAKSEEAGTVGVKLWLIWIVFFTCTNFRNSEKLQIAGRMIDCWDARWVEWLLVWRCSYWWLQSWGNMSQ